MEVAGVIGQAGQQGKARGQFRAIISRCSGTSAIRAPKLSRIAGPLPCTLPAANLRAAAFFAKPAEKLLEARAVDKNRAESKKKAELSLGQVQQGGMKQQERTQPLLQGGMYTYGRIASIKNRLQPQHCRHARNA
ncbi:MAG: hypothetical protein CFE33_19720 [Pseudorhodobacter sp. PARRP1]|nr:MAG: hypothetical protein CFE33_19720 [Pseudorhodobacter sp. PARRP1]